VNPVLAVLIPLFVLIAFDLAALRWGADSRPRTFRPNWW
jgi:hypothetical protein